MRSTKCFKRRPGAWAAACLLLTGAAVAQAPVQATPTPTTPTPPTPATAPAADINDFEHARPLTSTNLAGYTLARCIALTLRNYPRIHEARARLGYRREQQVQSWSQPYSEFNVTGGLALAPEVRGTTIYSPDTDVALSKHMGVGW